MPTFSYRLAETAAPATEPLTLGEMKTHLRVDYAADDSLILELIAAARQAAEQYTGRAFITRSYSLYMDSWPASGRRQWWDGLREGAAVTTEDSAVFLPCAPLSSVTRINVYGENGVAAEYAATNYFSDTVGAPGRIVLKDGASAPAPGRVANGIEIQFVAGYGTSSSNVPSALRQGMRQIVSHLYQHRGDSAETALSASGAVLLLQTYRIRSL